MRPDDLRDLLQQQPFPLLRLHLTDGTVIDLTHPDMAVVMRSAVRITLPPGPTGDREAVVAMLHIVWVEVVTPSP